MIDQLLEIISFCPNATKSTEEFRTQCWWSLLGTWRSIIFWFSFIRDVDELWVYDGNIVVEICHNFEKPHNFVLGFFLSSFNVHQSPIVLMIYIVLDETRRTIAAVAKNNI